MSGRIVPLSLVTVSAPLAANDAGSAFSLSANPLGPQPISVLFEAFWDGGSVTITGTAVDPKNPYNEAGQLVATPWSETVSPSLVVLPAAIETTRAFATVTAASKALVGASAATAQLKTLYPTQAPLQKGGNVAGAVDVHANLLILKAAVASGAIALQPLYWEEGRWWPQPGGALAVDDTMLNNSAVGRYVTCGDPTTYYTLWMTGTGTFSAAWLRGKVGPLSL